MLPTARVAAKSSDASDRSLRILAAQLRRASRQLAIRDLF
jgi:hypothetical protein